ncbi:hypothetical protein GGR51DRAFT_273518 [Nemania sp. FL0031]|nr:hypothetical protein GGR51DRAFT_273518 [Nemania sp. FL0031]
MARNLAIRSGDQRPGSSPAMGAALIAEKGTRPLGLADGQWATAPHSRRRLFGLYITLLICGISILGAHYSGIRFFWLVPSNGSWLSIGQVWDNSSTGNYYTATHKLREALEMVSTLSKAFAALVLSAMTRALPFTRQVPLDYTTSESGNPFVDGWYADPDTEFYEGKYWVFPTSSYAYDQQTYLDAFSSRDLINWEKHENILTVNDVTWARRAV